MERKENLAFYNVATSKKKTSMKFNKHFWIILSLSVTNTSIFQQIAGSFLCSSALTSEELHIFMLQRDALLAVLKENFPSVQEPRWHCQDPASLPPAPKPAAPHQGPQNHLPAPFISGRF